MFRMMELMHGNLDGNRMVACDAVSDAVLLEKGEETMEEMVGGETHGRMEAVMTEEAHDNMHIMMGIWATGCVGEETLNTMMERGGAADRLEELEREVQNQTIWPAAILGAVVGVVGGWVGRGFGK